jgi:hypothetical protein
MFAHCFAADIFKCDEPVTRRNKQAADNDKSDVMNATNS